MLFQELSLSDSLKIELNIFHGAGLALATLETQLKSHTWA